jgi:outer membrane protein assembly factor BamA
MTRLHKAVLLFFVSLLVSTSAFAQKYLISELVATGSDRYTSAEIIAYTGLKRDLTRPASLEEVRAAAQKLADSGVFSEVNYQHTAAKVGMRVAFTVKDKPADQFLPPIFENIVWLTPDELNAEIKKQIPIYRGDLPLKGHLTDEVAEAISQTLARKNVNAHVSASQSCRAEDDNCVFRLAIDNLHVITSQAEVSGLTPEITQEVQALAQRELANKPYERSTTNPAFAQIVRAACLKRGLLKPQISPVSTKIIGQSSSQVNVALAANVVPGQTYKFEGQTWSGNQAFPANKLERSVRLYLHLPVNGAMLEDDLRRVQADYSLAGFMHARIKPQAEFNDAAGIVKYHFVVQEGPQYKMGKFEVTGFPENIAGEVQDLWRLREGDPFDRNYIGKFFGEQRIIKLLGGQKFVVEQSEGEQPNSLDVTVVVCQEDGCKPSPDVLYVSRD